MDITGLVIALMIALTLLHLVLDQHLYRLNHALVTTVTLSAVCRSRSARPYFFETAPGRLGQVFSLKSMDFA